MRKATAPPMPGSRRTSRVRPYVLLALADHIGPSGQAVTR
ncbi:hypothetical protein ABH917_003487 [Thermobifida halotolerans]